MKRVGLMAELGHAASNDRYGKPHFEGSERSASLAVPPHNSTQQCHLHGLLDVGSIIPSLAYIHERSNTEELRAHEKYEGLAA